MHFRYVWWILPAHKNIWIGKHHCKCFQFSVQILISNFLGMVLPSYSPQTFGRQRQEDNEFQYWLCLQQQKRKEKGCVCVEWGEQILFVKKSIAHPCRSMLLLLHSLLTSGHWALFICWIVQVLHHLGINKSYQKMQMLNFPSTLH